MTRIPLLLAAVALVGCASDTPATDSAAAAAPTWSDDVAPIVEARCVSCHHDGGASPLVMETYDQVEVLGPAMKAAVERGSMPPWLPDPDCRSYVGERLMPDTEREVVTRWVDAGMPAGDASVTVAADIVGFEADLTAAPLAAYTPDFATTEDDYRCLVLDAEFPEEAWLSGRQALPGSPSVHHVLVFAIPPDDLAALEAADAAEDGPGYTCFGAPFPPDAGVGVPNQIAAWVPGLEPSVEAADTALLIQAGSKLVMQVHYSAVGGEPGPDTTRLEMSFLDTQPTWLVENVPLLVQDLEIPAGEPDVTVERVFRNWSNDTVDIASITAHMHLLGQSQELHVVRADGSEECALDLPEWDFAWQQAYDFLPDDHIRLAPGDGLAMRCNYDNSAENQPYVDGVQQQPRDVTWGEGTLDEMCLAYIAITQPYEPPTSESTPCAAIAGCAAACDENDIDCLLSCEDVPVECVTCALQSTLPCGTTACFTEVQGLMPCLTECIVSTLAFGGQPSTCLEATCPDGYASLLACADPLVSTDECSGVMADCGL